MFSPDPIELKIEQSDFVGTLRLLSAVTVPLSRRGAYTAAAAVGSQDNLNPNVRRAVTTGVSHFVREGRAVRLLAKVDDEVLVERDASVDRVAVDADQLRALAKGTARRVCIEGGEHHIDAYKS